MEKQGNKKNAFNVSAEIQRDSGVDTFSSDSKDVERYSPTALMYKNRIINVVGEVNTQMAVNVIAQLKHLETADPDAAITLLINSPGGSVIDGMAIVDVMREVKCPIRTVGNGMQASMGSVMLAAGDDRRMTKNSRLMIHQIMSGNGRGTQHTDIEIGAGLTTDLHEKLKSVYVEFTGLNHKYWDLVGERDTWFTSEQALKIGFINKIVTSEKPGGKYAVDAVRPIEEQNSEKVRRLQAIEKMSKDEVVNALSNGQSNEAEWGRYRPELATKLSEFPEFWTEGRRKEFALENPEKAKEIGLVAANDDKKAKAAPAPKMKEL